MRLRYFRVGVEDSRTYMRLDTVLVLAVLAIFARIIAQNDTALGSRNRGRVRISTEGIRALETELAKCWGLGTLWCDKSGTR